MSYRASNGYHTCPPFIAGRFDMPCPICAFPLSGDARSPLLHCPGLLCGQPTRITKVCTPRLLLSPYTRALDVRLTEVLPRSGRYAIWQATGKILSCSTCLLPDMQVCARALEVCDRPVWDAAGVAFWPGLPAANRRGAADCGGAVRHRELRGEGRFRTPEHTPGLSSRQGRASRASA